MRKILVMLTVLAATASRAVPPPPPPWQSRASYDAIDRLALIEGYWEGEQTDTAGRNVQRAARYVGRFGAGADHLLIGSLVEYGDRHPPGPLAPGPGTGSELHALTYDVLRGGYRIYDPSCFNDDLDPVRGHDEPVEITAYDAAGRVLAPIGRSDPGDTPPAAAAIVWKRTIRGGDQRQTITVSGDRWEERLESAYVDRGARVVRVVEVHLMRRSRGTVWGGLPR